MKKLNDQKEVIYICVCHSFTFSTFSSYSAHCALTIQKIMDEVQKDKVA